MFGVNPIKIMVIVAVVLLLLGPDKLPEVAHKLGSSWRALKRIQERVESEVREALPDLPSSGDLARMARSPVNLLNQLADQVDAREASPSPMSPNPYLEATDPIAAVPLITPPPPTPTERRAEETTLPPDPSLN
jgi:TatA/E family protein of Tat protein translocase